MQTYDWIKQYRIRDISGPYLQAHQVVQACSSEHEEREKALSGKRMKAKGTKRQERGKAHSEEAARPRKKLKTEAKEKTHEIRHAQQNQTSDTK